MPQLTTSRVPVGFAEATAPANGITMNYVRGGTGPTLVLLHGYPQTWYMWRKVLPALAEHFTVIAPDLRGAGGSDAPTDGYTKSSLAEDVHDLLVGLGLAEQVSLVGHDIGTMVAYAYAAAHRDSTSRLVLIEAPLAGETLYQLPSLTPQGPGLWNFGFFTLQNGLPERMLAGREDTWVDGFIDWLEVVKGGVDEQAIAEYAAQLRGPGRRGRGGNPAYLTAWLLDFLSDDHASPDAQNAMATA
jgi:pimeloyl-ACP methyl ester carboxylesterase